MLEEDENIFIQCFDQMESGVDQQGMMEYLHSQGVTAIEAVLIITKLYGLRVGVSIELIAKHPAWRADVQKIAATARPGIFAGQLTEPELPAA